MLIQTKQRPGPRFSHAYANAWDYAYAYTYDYAFAYA